MRRIQLLLSLLLLVLAFVAVGCVDDDDDDAVDDDDATGDDDDVTPGDPGEAMVDQTYCIDWDSADITDPPDIAGLLSGAGITLSDYPLLLSPTAVDVPGGTIDMLGATASPTTCTQDMTMSTLPLTDTTPGSWAPPHFVVGPTDMALNIPSVGLLVIEGAILEGDFTGDAQQIVNGSMDGFINVGSLPGACFLLTCATCPSGVGDCAVFAFANATWDNNGMGALTPIP